MHRPFLFLTAVLVLGACFDTARTPTDPATPPESAPPESAPPASADSAAGRALSVGDRAPDFTLPNADGEPVQLSDLLVDGPVVLTFYRGAWCPYCNTQLRDYEQSYPQVREAGARVVAISPQTAAGTAEMDSSNALSFPVLSDVGNVVSRRYGLVFRVGEETRRQYQASGIDLAAINGTDEWELPVPATYVIDRAGTIQAAFVEADYTQRASSRQVLEALTQVL